MKEGKNQKLLCKTKAGKPPAQLVWYMGEHMMDSQYSVNGDTVQAKITFVPRIEDNGMVLRCEARNDAVADPVVNTLVLGVDRVSITTRKPETTKKYDDDSNVHGKEKDLMHNIIDEYTSNHEYISNNDYPDYGYDDYASNWTQYNSIEDYHPEETHELTTKKPDVEELPSKSENDPSTNIVHKNYQSNQVVEINDDPDIKVRSSEQFQKISEQFDEENRSGRNQDTSDSKLNAMHSLERERMGSSASGLERSLVSSIIFSTVVLLLRLY